MSRFFIYKCVAYLLIALLPLQAVAAGRLALCAENPSELAWPSASVQTKTSVRQMDRCAQMASMQVPAADATKSTGKPTCWLGSICVVSLGAMALSAPYKVSPAQHSVPIAFSTSAVYLSIISDTPQRPPATL